MFLSINNKLNIAFCGMMGSGKSSLGKIIANKINYDFYDIDRIIEERSNKTISEIFKNSGEEFFRKLEEEITLEMLIKEKCIISLGGGAITNNIIRNSIKHNSYNIYIKVNIKNLYKRLIYSKNRPLINESNLNQVLLNLLKKRKKFYEDADLIVNNNKTINETVEYIMKKISDE
tara:strand:+ start:5530 stop:6054 length:525 start_codon:yes stop_codon:yes gene_type:complete